MNRWIKKIFVLMAILFMVVQPVFVPTVYAVQSWTGDPWEGESWKGSPWDGADIEWEGETWEGDKWTGDSWEGNGTSGPESPTGQTWDGVQWYLDGWSQNDTNGNPWSSNGFDGNGTPGSPWLQPEYGYGLGGMGTPWSGDGTAGNGTSGSPWMQPGDGNGPGSLATPWLMPGYNGNGTNGDDFYGNGTDGDPNSIDDFATLPFEYDVGKYVVNDVMMGQVNLAGDVLTSQNMRDLGYDASMNYGLGYRGNLLMNGLKLGVGDNVVFDAYDTYSHVDEGIGAIQDFNTIRNAQRTTDTVGDLASASINVSGSTPPAASVGALSKFNVAAAAVGTGFSAVETGYNTARAVDVLSSDASGADKTVAVTDATASLGDTLMNAGVVTSAIPGAQAVGAGMVAVGAGVWAVSKGVRFVASHWKGNWKETGKAMWKSTKDTAKKAWDTVTGWFS